MLLFEKLHSFYFSESNVTKLYSNIETLIDVPLLILRKIQYLQFTEIINSNNKWLMMIRINKFVRVFMDIVLIIVQNAV